MFDKAAAFVFTVLVISAHGFSVSGAEEKSSLDDDSEDTTQPGTSGVESEPRLLPAYKNETPSVDVDYEVPHVVNTTEGPPSGGRSGISPAYGGRRGSRELGTSRRLPGRGGMGGIRYPAEERRGRDGSKQLLFPRDNLVSRQRRESENGSHSKAENPDKSDNNDDDQGDDGDYDDFEDEDGDLLHKQGRSGTRPRPGSGGPRNFPGRGPRGKHAGCFWWRVYPRPSDGGDGDGGDDGGDDYDYDYSRYSRRRRNRKAQKQKMRRKKKKTITEDGTTQKISNG